MTIPDMTANVVASSDQPGAANIIPRLGAKTPDYWSPQPNDTKPELKVVLPPVSGIPPEEYDVMTIKITAMLFFSVTVTVVDSQNQSTFSVSVFFVGRYMLSFAVMQEE